MKRVLFVDCCIRREESRTKKIASHFLNELKNNGGYEIDTICLMDEGISYLSGDFFEEREKLLKSKQLDHPRFQYARDFASYDKIVVAAPFWDLSFPALLKAYIENLCVEGITFQCDETGCFGTCKADNMLYITTRGDNFTDSPLEMGSRYMEAMCIFFGIDTYDCIAAEGLDLGVIPVEEIIDGAMEKATKLSKDF